MSKTQLWNTWNSGSTPNYPHEKVVQFIFRTFPRKKREHVRLLDLGCGSGVHTQFLASEGFDVVARDLSPVGVANTLARCAAVGCPADVAVGTVDAINAPDESFDGVVSIGVLDCAGPAVLSAAIGEVTRVLRPGGTALLILASDTDFRVSGPNPLGLYGFTDAEVKAVRAQVIDKLGYFWLDRYITTYQDKTLQQNDHLLTLHKEAP
jgi:cyclopropane fatty-acyl-phospholipid synthase-like methyltransferase